MLIDAFMVTLFQNAYFSIAERLADSSRNEKIIFSMCWGWLVVFY